MQRGHGQHPPAAGAIGAVRARRAFSSSLSCFLAFHYPLPPSNELASHVKAPLKLPIKASA